MTTQITPRIPVSTNEAITSFVNALPVGERFTREELLTYVSTFNFGTSKETILRALRVLKSRGVLSYEIVNSSKGIYQVTALYAEPVESASKDGIGDY